MAPTTKAAPVVSQAEHWSLRGEAENAQNVIQAGTVAIMVGRMNSVGSDVKELKKPKKSISKHVATMIMKLFTVKPSACMENLEVIESDEGFQGGKEEPKKESKRKRIVKKKKQKKKATRKSPDNAKKQETKEVQDAGNDDTTKPPGVTQDNNDDYQEAVKEQFDTLKNNIQIAEATLQQLNDERQDKELTQLLGVTQDCNEDCQELVKEQDNMVQIGKHTTQKAEDRVQKTSAELHQSQLLVPRSTSSISSESTLTPSLPVLQATLIDDCDQDNSDMEESMVPDEERRGSHLTTSGFESFSENTMVPEDASEADDEMSLSRVDNPRTNVMMTQFSEYESDGQEDTDMQRLSGDDQDRLDHLKFRLPEDIYEALKKDLVFETYTNDISISRLSVDPDIDDQLSSAKSMPQIPPEDDVSLPEILDGKVKEILRNFHWRIRPYIFESVKSSLVTHRKRENRLQRQQRKPSLNKVADSVAKQLQEDQKKQTRKQRTLRRRNTSVHSRHSSSEAFPVSTPSVAYNTVGKYWMNFDTFHQFCAFILAIIFYRDESLDAREQRMDSQGSSW